MKLLNLNQNLLLKQTFSTKNFLISNKIKIFILLNNKIADKILINPSQSLNELRKNISIKINYNFLNEKNLIIKKECESKFQINEILKENKFIYIKEKEKLIQISNGKKNFSIKIGKNESLNNLRKKLQLKNDYVFIKNNSQIIQKEENNILIKDCLIDDKISLKKIKNLKHCFSEKNLEKNLDNNKKNLNNNNNEISYIFSLNKTISKHKFQKNLFLFEIREKLNYPNTIFFLNKNNEKIALENEDQFTIDSIATKENSLTKKIFLLEIIKNTPISSSEFLYTKNSLKIFKYPSQKLQTLDLINSKNIIIIGETGSGKTTFINSFINYLMNININDDFRYILINEGQNQNQKDSQTSEINSYFIKPENNSIPAIKIIDTPGFGDTRENFDESLIEKFKICFHNENYIDLVCFVMKSSNNRFTEYQKYIMSNILGLFGKDLTKNFLVLFTFCDGNEPNFIDSLKSEENPFCKYLNDIKEPWYLKFNNSAFFSEKKKFNEIFWNLSYDSFGKLIEKFNVVQTGSLKLSKNVLITRKKILLEIEKINEEFNKCLEITEKLNEMIKILEVKNEEIKLNSNFKTIVNKDCFKKINSGKHNLICLKCNSTCHKKCNEITVENIKNCINFSNNFCKICKCSINEHKDLPFYIEKTIKKETIFNNKILENYEKAKIEYSIQISSIDEIKKTLEKKKNEINDYVQKINNLIKKLNEIALYSNIYENLENYCDYQIKVEKSEMKKGFEKRIKKIQDKKMRSYKLGRLFRNKNVYDDNLNEHLNILSNSMKSINEDVYNTIQNVEN